MSDDVLPKLDEWRWGELPRSIEGLLSEAQRDELARDLADMAQGRRLAEMSSAEIVLAVCEFKPRDGVLTPGWKRCAAVLVVLLDAADPCPDGCATPPEPVRPIGTLDGSPSEWLPTACEDSSLLAFGAAHLPAQEQTGKVR